MNLAQKLGYSKYTKLLIIHADDAGLCHSENRATVKCLEEGIVNSCSIMVPCPWFYEMGIFARNNPQYDCGIHLTLTCEWENYKFGSILPISEVPSLVDENGHFYKKREQLAANAIAEEVEKELDAQIQKALRLGVQPTHLDSHMYSVGASEVFFEVYRNLGEKYELPVMISGQLLEMVGLDAEKNIKEGDVLIERAHFGHFDQFKAGKLYHYYDYVLGNLVEGLNIILIHPAFDDEEMKGVTVNHPNFGAAWRQIDADYFSTKKNGDKISDNAIQLITWGDIKKVMH